MITVCIYPPNIGARDKPAETADKLLSALENSPTLPTNLDFKFKYQREVRDMLGGRHPARAHMSAVKEILLKHFQFKAMQTLGVQNSI